MLERADRIHKDTMIKWGQHVAGTKSFTRLALVAFNKIQLGIATDEDIVTLRLLERINENADYRRL